MAAFEFILWSDPQTCNLTCERRKAVDELSFTVPLFFFVLIKKVPCILVFYSIGYVRCCISEESVCSDSKNRSLPLTLPINMTSRKHIGIINHSVACFKILSFSSRWQHGLPLIPFISDTCAPLPHRGHYILWLKCLMKNRKSEDSAHQALFWWITVMLVLLSLLGMSRFDIFALSPPEQ